MAQKEKVPKLAKSRESLVVFFFKGAESDAVCTKPVVLGLSDHCRFSLVELHRKIPVKRACLYRLQMQFTTSHNNRMSDMTWSIQTIGNGDFETLF